jgi:tetratricopeptide (TPR) repeat protein
MKELLRQPFLFFRPMLWCGIITFGIPVSAVLAQTNKIDSLLKELETAKHDTAKVYLLLSIAYNYWSVSPVKMPEHLDRAEALLASLDYPNGHARLNNIRGIYYWTQGDYPNTLKYYTKAHDIYRQHGQLRNAAVSEINIGMLYTELGNYAKSLEYLKSALSTLEKTQGNESHIAEIHNLLGEIYKNLHDFDNALKSYTTFLQYSTHLNDSISIASAYTNIGDIYLEKGDAEKSFLNQEKALHLYTKAGHQMGVLYCYFRLGKCYFSKNDFSEANIYFNKALQVSQEINANNLIVPILNYLGKSYEATHDVTRSIRYYEEALAHTAHSKKVDKLETFKNLAHGYSTIKKFEKAYTYMQQAALLSDSIFNDETRKKIMQMQIDTETAKKNEEIKLLKKDQQIKTLIQFLIIACLVIVLITILASITRHKKQKLLLNKERELLASRLQQEQLLKEQLTSEIEFKSKELTNFTLNLIQKNNFLEELKEYIHELRATADENVSQRLHALLQKINHSFRLDKDWETFKKHFEHVNESFFQKLRLRYPELSSQELKLCALAKLDLSNKEIASILGIGVDSVKVARSRLRKKLNIQTDQRISNFLAQITSMETVA